jgi:hypothetical protein
MSTQAHNTTLLKFMPNEDVSIGFWLMSVDLRRINNQRVLKYLACIQLLVAFSPLLHLLKQRTTLEEEQAGCPALFAAVCQSLLPRAGGHLGPPLLLRARQAAGRHPRREPRLVPRHRGPVPRAVAHPAQDRVRRGDAVSRYSCWVSQEQRHQVMAGMQGICSFWTLRCL